MTGENLHRISHFQSERQVSFSLMWVLKEGAFSRRKSERSLMLKSSKPISGFRHKEPSPCKMKRSFWKIRWKSQGLSKLLLWILFSPSPKLSCLKDFSISTPSNTTLSNPKFSLEYFYLNSFFIQHVFIEDPPKRLSLARKHTHLCTLSIPVCVRVISHS